MGNFDRSRFNEFVAGKPSVMPSLFEKSNDYQNMKNLNQSLGQEAAPQPKQQQSYTSADLWNKLNTASVQPKSTQGAQPASFATAQEPAMMTNAELDKKYGISNNSPIQSVMPQPQRPVQPNASNLNSNIKVDDAYIPPFLRRKFNK